MDDLDPNTARFVTIITSMYKGDLRPLAAAILEGRPVDPTVLYNLAIMINEGLVIAKGRTAVRRPRGRPKQTDKSVRERMMAKLYVELAKNLPSVDAFRQAAKAFKTTEDIVRKAVASQRQTRG
jgi:hypothetical protein